ncbi:MAG: S1 RNA-binding domain-containing protein [Natronincolaceae bacterium]
MRQGCNIHRQKTSPLDVVSVDDEVEVRIIGLDIEHGRILLSMK